MSRRYDPGVPLDDDVHRDLARGISSLSALTIAVDGRLARYVELAGVKPSPNGATRVCEPDLRDHAALPILNGAETQVRWRRRCWPRSADTLGGGEQGSRWLYDPRLHRGGVAHPRPLPDARPMLSESASRPAAEASDSTERRPAPSASEAITGPTGVQLVAALDRAWQDIRRRHEEVPPVVLLVGPSPSRPRAKRRTLGYFTALGWSVPTSDGFGGLRAAENPLAEADEKEDRYSDLAAQADAIVLNLAELCREMSNTRGELFMATELVARGATEMFAVLLHEAAHTIASRRGIKDTSRQGRYHNGRFRMIAGEVGLDGDRDPRGAGP